MEKLEKFLIKQTSKCFSLRVNSDTLSNDINSYLNEYGCCHIILDSLGIKSALITKKLLDQTFDIFKNKSYENALEFWRKNPFSVHHVWGNSSKMPYPPILETTERISFTHPELKTVHVKNPLCAQNSVLKWELLIEEYPQLRPSEWLKSRYHVSEDGIKISYNETYKITPLHYDGQLFDERIQIIYCNDKGPMRLHVIPGSNSQTFQELIKEITGISVIVDGFKTLSKHINDKLYKLLLKYSICCNEPHLQFFKAGVWHFEGNKDDDNILKNETKKSIISRSYIGIVPIQLDRIPDIIHLAYLREHGWTMDSFASENKKNRRGGLFVNDKSNQASNVFDDYEENREEFNRLKQTDRQYLREQCSDLRLELYGLKKTDLF